VSGVAELPTVGDKIPVEKFHVSRFNVRAEEAFGEAEEDKHLIADLRKGKIIGPFKARPEDKDGRWKPGTDLSKAVGYGVVVGRRRFLGKKEAGAKFFTVGSDCLIEEMEDEEARRASLIENLEIFQKRMNPITRAKRLSEMLTFSPLDRETSLRGLSRQWDISASTLSEWLKVLELSPKMQEAVARGLLFYTDALILARMKLGKELQDRLAEVLEREGYEAFKAELARVTSGKLKRGIPRGIYEIDRVVWDKRNRKEMGYYEILANVAEKKGMKVPEYIKDFLIRHINDIQTEIA